MNNWNIWENIEINRNIVTKRVSFRILISHLLKEKSEFPEILLDTVSTVFFLFQWGKSLRPLLNDSPSGDKPIWWLIQNYMILYQLNLLVMHAELSYLQIIVI